MTILWSLLALVAILYVAGAYLARDGTDPGCPTHDVVTMIGSIHRASPAICRPAAVWACEQGLAAST
jgi:hypothetical protein